MSSAIKKIALIFVVLIIAAASGAYYWINTNINAPVTHDQANAIISISRGKSLDEILSQLEAAHIIKSAVLTRLYIRLVGHAPVVKAGDYRFKSPITPGEVLSTLESGGIELNKLTVIEGWTRFDIADAMVAIPTLKLKNRAQALSLMNNTALIKDLDPVVSNLEGYLFPDTYFVQTTTKPEELIAQMVTRFRSVWQEAQKNCPNPYHLTTHNAVTAASVIETEAKLASERPVIASVIFNRIRKGMTLSMDSTIVYASKLIGKWKGNGIIYQSDIDLKSPYNTRKYKGLPPGPVGSPSKSSLEAALSPANTAYLYYVREPARNDGAHNFYMNPEGFEIGVQKLRAWEEAERRAGRR
ncbi:MAG: endolytic transglycosylase MltG [Cyanobacteria bacterium SZAS LIN-3]|nr:endolytic transglycosylase MltG [Cyanobacteria bacterium SZAS LIN-3]